MKNKIDELLEELREIVTDVKNYTAGDTTNFKFLEKYGDDLINCVQQAKANEWQPIEELTDKNDNIRYSIKCIDDEEIYIGQFNNNGTLFIDIIACDLELINTEKRLREAENIIRAMYCNRDAKGRFTKKNAGSLLLKYEAKYGSIKA